MKTFKYMEFGFFLFLLLASLYVLSGCAGQMISMPTQKIDSETIYKRDMVLTVNGKSDEGVLVVPMLAENTFHVISKGNLDLFSMTTCHREWTKEKAWNVIEEKRGGLFGWGSRKIEKKREVQFSYFPVKGMEDKGACPVQLSGFDATGKHSWGFVDFKTPDLTLPGKIMCNGESYDFDGVAACQARTGLIQRLIFKSPVIVSPDPGCELGATSGVKFEFPMPRGVCVYRFEDLKDQKIVGKVTLIGYESILIRQE